MKTFWNTCDWPFFHSFTYELNIPIQMFTWTGHFQNKLAFLKNACVLVWSKTRVKSKLNTQVWCIHSIRRCTNTFCYPAFIDSHKCGGTWGCQVSWTGEWDPLSRWLHPEQVNSWTSLPQSQTLSGVEHSKPSLCMKTLFLTQKTTKIIRLYMSASHCGLLVPHPSWNWSNQEEPGVFITPNGLHVLYRLIVFGMTHWQASSKFVSHSVCVKMPCFVCISKPGT